MDKHPWYITTTLPYVNADPHIGFALELIQADVLARYHRLLGDTVVFNTGTDEHGLKIYEKALEQGMDPKSYCDMFAAKYDALKSALNVSYTHFIRTTDPHHEAAAQEFWRRCEKKGDIYKKNYRIKYCVGCELEKTDSDLVDGKCPVHPTREIEFLEEENYFFRFSNYQKPLLDWYQSNSDVVVPGNRLEEIRQFVLGGLQDFSVSRLKSKLPWGIEVPGDPDHVMYVWFDALINYISTLGWFEDEKVFSEFWPGIQVAGKDNLRQQSAMWQAMLMSAGLPASKQIFIHGFITHNGDKMSKSFGNVVDPFAIVDQYGTDPLRWYLLGAVPSYDDGDFSEERFKEFYTATLANGIGNLTARILAMIEKYENSVIPKSSVDSVDVDAFWKRYEEAFRTYQFDEVVKIIMRFVSLCDEKITKEKPWEKIKAGESVSDLLYTLSENLRQIAVALLPFLPSSAEKILASFGIAAPDVLLSSAKLWGGLKGGEKIQKISILFPREG